MSNNKTFFADARDGKMTLGDIFSDVFKRHTAEETARVLSVGTAVTTPREPEMLSNWQKPFLFARFFLGYGVMLLLAYLMGSLLGHEAGYYLLLVGIPFLVPVTLLLLVWEMNVPRNISLYDVVVMVGLGGILSLIATVILGYYSETSSAVWAGLIEEPAKLIVIYIILHKKNYKHAINGVLIGAAVGTGFAVMETLFYVFTYMFVGIDNFLILCATEGMSAMNVAENFGLLWESAMMFGLNNALARAVTAISGHGVFAALYGGALVKAKGEEEIGLVHLFKVEFLLYFAVSILLHALHNYGIDLGLPVLLDGLLPCEYVIIAAIAIALLVNSLRIGVDEAVRYCAKLNGGSVTMAVNRNVVGTAPAPRGGSQAPARRPYPETSPTSGMQVRVRVVSGALAGKTFTITEGRYMTLGRSNSCDISFPSSSSVSGTHCRIEVKGGRAALYDMNSTNGTYVNKKRMPTGQVQYLNNGDVINLANEEASVQISY